MPTNATYTYADLVAEFPVDNVQREIIDGELIVSPSPSLRHQRLSARLSDAIRAYLTARGGGEVFYSPVDVLFSDHNVVQPDLLFIPADRAEIMTEKNVQGVPALLIEIVSDTRRDRVRKRDLYARFGVPEYWIVDPDADRIEVYRLHDGSYGKPQIHEPGDTLTYERLPGLAIELARIFAR